MSEMKGLQSCSGALELWSSGAAQRRQEGGAVGGEASQLWALAVGAV